MFYNNQYVVISHVLVDALKGAWHTYTVDISQVIAEKSWHAASWMTSPGLTDDEAVTVLENIQQITIIGNPSAGQTSAGTYFLVDRLGWVASTP